MAVAAWRKEHPADASKLEEGQKEANQVFEDARSVLLAIATRKADPVAFKAGQAKLEKSIEPLKARLQKEGTDPWAKLVTPIAEDFLKLATDLAPKVTDKGLEPEAFVRVVFGFVNLVESRQRALSRAMMSKAQQDQAAATGAASAAVAPSAAPPATH